MKNKIFVSITASVVVIILLVGFASKAAPSPLERKIVVFEKGFANKAELINNAGGKVIKDLPLVNGMAVMIPSKAQKALEKKQGVLRVENDDLVFAVGKPVCNHDGICQPGETSNCSDCDGEEEPISQPPQETAWGVNRIKANLAWAASTGSMVKVAIIDSGIDEDHLDLMDNIKGGYNAINPRKSWNDDNGHGTHVAGIVAALDNGIGVVGVAPKAELYAVKVLNRMGIGFVSDIIDGLNWCINNEIDVANMSIGSSGCSETYHQAIILAKNAGITIAAAAGNNGETDGSIVCPAKWPETIAVSATNINDGLAYFSSYGEEIDLAAPGQAINSTWNDGGYHVGSGTSMAAPHVAGVAALILADPDLQCDTNLDGVCTPYEVQTRLENTVELLPGLTNFQQGAGLADAQAAVEEKVLEN